MQTKCLPPKDGSNISVLTLAQRTALSIYWRRCFRNYPHLTFWKLNPPAPHNAAKSYFIRSAFNPSRPERTNGSKRA